MNILEEFVDAHLITCSLMVQLKIDERRERQLMRDIPKVISLKPGYSSFVVTRKGVTYAIIINADSDGDIEEYNIIPVSNLK